jgi:hypothetical protein
LVKIMIVTAREYTAANAAEMRANAAAIHARLMNHKAKPRVMALPAPVIAAPVPRPVLLPIFRPEWKRQETYFDNHVIESRRILDMLKAGEIELVNVGRRTVSQIVDLVLKDFPKITISQVKGAGRRRDVVAARQKAMWVVRQERPDLSFPAIGRWFGGRDHTTVLHAVRKIDAMRVGR